MSPIMAMVYDKTVQVFVNEILNFQEIRAMTLTESAVRHPES